MKSVFDLTTPRKIPNLNRNPDLNLLLRSVFIRVHSWLTVFLLLGCLNGLAADPVSDALQKGLFEEEANHNLDAAIKAYQSVIDQTAEQRKLTATAVFRLGECYRKLNKTNEAVAQYERVLREFADISALSTLSQQNLAALGKNVSPEVGTTAATSAEAEEIQKIKAMIKYSPDLINAPHQAGMTPLGTAALAGHLTVVRFLLDNKADINSKDHKGYTALHHAVYGGHKAIVEFLLDRGADLNARDDHQNQPLHYAASKGYRSVLESLIARKADVNAKGQSGRTPLHSALKEKQIAIAALLLERGADLNAQDQQGWTPLHYAVSNPNFLELLLKHRPNVELADNEGSTPLMLATINGDVRSLELLLKAGANVNANAANQLTPLMVAVNRGDIEKVRLLLEHKADPNKEWGSRGSPLAWALRETRTSGRAAEKAKLQEIADLLRQYGAKESPASAPTIGITRNGKELNYNYLKRDPQGLNQFTLFELLAYLYDGRGPRESANTSGTGPKFPDFSNIQITSPEPHGGKRISKLNLEDALTSGDCSKDVLLEWGDIVDIPEKDHKLSEQWKELPREIRETLSNCLARNVNITVKGETTTFRLRPKFWPYHSQGGKSYLPGEGLPFLRLRNVLEASGLLRASSDRTRVHVTRKVAGGGPRQFVFNLERQSAEAEEDLLLQDGDSISVPDKT